MNKKNNKRNQSNLNNRFKKLENNKIKKLDQKIKHLEENPVSKQKVQKYKQPKIVTKSKSTIISHSEFITSLKSSGNGLFENLFISNPAINPTNANVFPWGSKLGFMFDKYRILKLQFRFETSSSMNTTGTLMMAIDYDPNDNPPGSETDFQSYSGMVSGAVWQS